MPAESTSLREQLSGLFAYRAEWMKDKVFELFAAPSYFPELKAPRPCALFGGRGTGKTTVLRGLSYEGQFQLCKQNPKHFSEIPFIGFYHRIDTNQVRAFDGPELPEHSWVRWFSHYYNLRFVDAILEFLIWHDETLGEAIHIQREDFQLICKSLHLEIAGSLPELSHLVRIARTELESLINSVCDAKQPRLSMLGRAVDLLLSAIKRSPQLTHKQFFFLLDEYENLSDYQQRTLNTLIKHCGEVYSFKIGVRDFGWRVKSTLNNHEVLTSPADYDKIEITEKVDDSLFEEFARSVCSERLSRLRDSEGQSLGHDIAQIFGEMSVGEEAQLLRGDRIAAEVRSRCDELQIRHAGISDIYLLLANEWATAKDADLATTLQDVLARPVEWKNRLNNYGYPLLFTLKQGKSGIRKFYAGWRVFCKLAGRNIRYLIELVDQALVLHFQEQEGFGGKVSPAIQTKAAQRVGQKNIAELESIPEYGGHLAKFVLALGRVFEVLAKEGLRHAPEVNQFHISDECLSTEVQDLLNAAVMHLAILRFPGNKRSSESDTREYEFMLHPIFSAFLEFSYRKKRQLRLSGAEFLGLINEPPRYIKSILRRSDTTIPRDVPEQLLLFEAFYNENS